MEYSKINWSPFATNVLDANDFDLCIPDGTPVDFHRDGGGFVLVINGKRFATDDNIQMSYWMNQYQIGGLPKRQDNDDYPMVPGEGAPQYTFDLGSEPVQLSLM
jgi:hypothetical protein